MGFKRMVTDSTPRSFWKACENCEERDGDFPLHQFVTIPALVKSGDPGTCWRPALLRHFGKSTDAPGTFDPPLLGAISPERSRVFDQSALRQRPRAQPGDYVGAGSAFAPCS
jgi:excinuclease ABC subunit A